MVNSSLSSQSKTHVLYNNKKYKARELMKQIRNKYIYIPRHKILEIEYKTHRHPKMGMKKIIESQGDSLIIQFNEPKRSESLSFVHISLESREGNKFELGYVPYVLSERTDYFFKFLSNLIKLFVNQRLLIRTTNQNRSKTVECCAIGTSYTTKYFRKNVWKDPTFFIDKKTSAVNIDTILNVTEHIKVLNDMTFYQFNDYIAELRSLRLEPQRNDPTIRKSI